MNEIPLPNTDRNNPTIGETATKSNSFYLALASEKSMSCYFWEHGKQTLRPLGNRQSKRDFFLVSLWWDATKEKIWVDVRQRQRQRSESARQGCLERQGARGLRCYRVFLNGSILGPVLSRAHPCSFIIMQSGGTGGSLWSEDFPRKYEPAAVSVNKHMLTLQEAPSPPPQTQTH